ncbi:hypothetical protein QJT89_21215, partial [Bordetella bronchiseptica]
MKFGAVPVTTNTTMQDDNSFPDNESPVAQPPVGEPAASGEAGDGEGELHQPVKGDAPQAGRLAARFRPHTVQIEMA